MKFLGVFPVPMLLVKLLAFLAETAVIVYTLWNAFRIRTYALVEYGMVIHEFDPWFNFRATLYLYKHGWDAFFHWFDHMSWYPLGRPVGTTIYPGLQITSVAIHWVLRQLGKDWRMSLNDVCCYVPAWGGATATLFCALVTYELTMSWTSAMFTSMVMSVVPAHMMRSVGGGYDNESIAMTAMLMTFYFWMRSLRSHNSWTISVLAGLSYGYMVAAWGGYIFVLNMIAVHAALTLIVDTCRNIYSSRLVKSYTIFYIIGTYLAICVPPVGMAPFKSLEQLFALFVFVVLIVVHVSERFRKRAEVPVRSTEGVLIRLKALAVMGAVVFLICLALAPTGFFGPLSSRVRGLFVKHTRTGNPLVDSVAEHQPASAEAYWHYLHIAYFGWQFGVWLVIPMCLKRLRAALFIFAYSCVAYFFSNKMARLIILTGPVASILSGMILGFIIEWVCAQFVWSEADKARAALAKEGRQTVATTQKEAKKVLEDQTIEGWSRKLKLKYIANIEMRAAIAVLIIAVFCVQGQWKEFNAHSENMAHAFSNPQLMFKTHDNKGNEIIIDDYREAYFWIRDHTPQDSRVMAWWDYGYQITGIANRTSIADGNTWNHEHIATLGKCLTSPVKEAHSLVRHLADYVLVWAGGGGDDLAKSPHMARIGNSVYRDICPSDPLCLHFGFKGQNFQDPTPMMRKSLLYNLHAHNVRPGVRIDPKLFREVYTSKYGLIRVFQVMNVSQESKDWCANPANYKCDAPGSWYCEGQYPPAPEIQALLAKRRDFGQLEDFNRRSADDEYYRQYMQRMGAMG